MYGSTLMMVEPIFISFNIFGISKVRIYVLVFLGWLFSQDAILFASSTPCFFLNSFSITSIE